MFEPNWIDLIVIDFRLKPMQEVQSISCEKLWTMAGLSDFWPTGSKTGIPMSVVLQRDAGPRKLSVPISKPEYHDPYVQNITLGV